jgi:hypothetical protein
MMFGPGVLAPRIPGLGAADRRIHVQGPKPLIELAQFS